MLSDAFTWIVLHPFIAGAVLILCLIVLERLTRRKWPWRFKATVTYVCDGDSVWVKRRIGDRMKLRLLGMDAPDSLTGRKPPKPYENSFSARKLKAKQ